MAAGHALAMIRRHMRPAQTIEELSQFERRGAGTNSERRASSWLATQTDSPSRACNIEPFWCRPNWALAHAWHVGLALLGSLLSVNSPRIGGALVLAALISVVADELLGISPGRRLTLEHASQNIHAAPTTGPPNTTHLIITANYDAGRTGLCYRRRIRTAAAGLRRAAGGRAPGWLTWLSVTFLWLIAVAILRLEGSKGAGVGVLQLVPTVVLVLSLALLLELASADFSPAANDNASGTAAALALTAALDAAPPRHATVELLLQGASDGSGLGLRRHLRARRKQLRAHNAIVIGVGPCAAGQVRWWTSDGALIPLRYLPQLQRLCAQVAADLPELGAKPHRGRGSTAALPARAARIPAIAIGSVSGNGIIAHSHQRSDTQDHIDQDAIDDMVQFGLTLVEHIDAYLAARRATPPSAPAYTPAQS